MPLYSTGGVCTRVVSHICIELLTPNGGGSIARSPHLGGIYAVKRVSMTPAGYFFAIELLYTAPALTAVVRKNEPLREES
jgi:hypothetical protein